LIKQNEFHSFFGMYFFPKGLSLAGQFIFFFCGLGFQAQAVEVSHISQVEQTRIADLIFKNECNRELNCLVSWNDGEDFSSLGIGHFIWFPEYSEAPFQESFPELLRWMQTHDVVIPQNLKHILKPELACPWQNKADFLKAENQRIIQDLRIFLAKTKQVQTTFMIHRLQQALPKMLKVTPDSKAQQHIKRQFERVAQSPNGWYALVDYVNFKGEGIKTTERYQGKGWGLSQVLLSMDERVDVMAGFRAAAKSILKQRVEQSPAERNEQRWLKGWFKRLDTY